MTDPALHNSSPHKYSPKEFLRGRRPEQFSDTQAAERPQLDRTLLEYHLDSLTSRSQENDFETFCRRLAEQEICPNLVPHTGPTGGGDSKVDSETYPVSDALADTWYTGLGREAATERWAFAFSAKKEWRPKVKKDIVSIASTNRGYTTAFFISSRFIPDKARAEVEDKLTSEHGFQVRILDRNWILDKVFQNRHEAIAIEALRMQVGMVNRPQPGPQDARRQTELAEAQTRVQEAISQQHYSVALVDECLEAAILARQLERPASETDGLFMRACRLAAKYGTSQQSFTCLYQRAWTAYWWYEDWDLFTELYSKVEAAVLGSTNAFDLERLQNLWMIYQTGVHHNYIVASAEELTAKNLTLRAEFTRLTHEQHRPSTALQARLQLLLLDLTSLVQADNLAEAKAVFEQMQDVVRESQGLVGFVLDPLVEMISELGPLFLDLPTYDELFSQLVEVSSARKSEVVAASLLVERGAQLTDGGRPAEAIKKFGIALSKLYKHESREKVVVALAFCGIAYTAVGLHWAARNSTLFSASIATDEFYRYGDTTAAQVTCFYRLSWLELQLGRIGLALAWYETYLIIGRVLVAKREYDAQKFEEQSQKFDMVLGLLLLKTNIEQLTAIIALPAILGQLELFNSEMAALFALGYEQELLQQEPFNEQPGQLHVFFENWLELRVEGHLPDKLVFYEGSTICLNSIVLGCEVQVEATNELATLLLAESLTAGFESLLATSIGTGLLLKEPRLTVDIQRTPDESSLIAYEATERDGRPYLAVRCGTLETKPSSMPAQQELKTLIGDLLLTMLACVIAPTNLDSQLTSLFKDEQVNSRAVDFNSSFITITNLLGDTPKFRLTDWPIAAESLRPSKRTQAWYNTRSSHHSNSEEVIAIQAESNTSPKSPVKHSEIKINSLIRDPLWDRAKWVGAAFLQSPQMPCPALGLLFTNEEAARQIFELWRQELTPHDEKDRLRVSLVRGFDKDKPLAYRTIISSNIGPIGSNLAPETKQFDGYQTVASRIHEMHNPTANHVDPFQQLYNKHKTYLLVPAVWAGPGTQPHFFFELGILKHQLFVREAWEVGLNDMDMVGIRSGDDPLVPTGVTEQPVKALLQLKRS